MNQLLRNPRLFDEFFPALVWENKPEPLPIRVDVRENASAYIVQAELPGVRKEGIAVEIEGNEVTISAESKRETRAKFAGGVLELTLPKKAPVTGRKVQIN